jgi:cell division protein FtsL
MKEKVNDSLTWFQINNIVPIVTSIVIIALSWASLGAKIDLLNQKVDYLSKQVEEYNQRNKEIQTRVGTAESNIQVIFTKLGMLK